MHVRTHASTRKVTGDISPPPVSLIVSSSLFTIYSLHTPSTTCLLRGSNKKNGCRRIYVRLDNIHRLAKLLSEARANTTHAQ